MAAGRPLWAYLFFAHLALVIAATVLATRGRFPTTVFQAPYDKAGHLAAYGGLAFLAVGFFGHARRWRVLAILLAVATAEEFSQRLFPTRTFDVGDLAMNVLGIVGLGMMAAVVVRRRGEPVLWLVGLGWLALLLVFAFLALLGLLC